MYIQLFPIYGFNVGINYWDNSLNEDYNDGDEKEYLIQFMFGLIGISIHWW